MIELKNVYKYYNANGVTNIGLQNINLKLNKGEFIAITGESGSGKSTLLNVISKIDNFDDGEILYKGNETSYFSISDMDDFRKNKVGFIFQNYNILDSYTVLENVMLPLLLKGLSKIDAKNKALDLIEKVGLKNKIKNRGSKLSGGEKQRCVIARALASDCEILACDEPTGNLDHNTALEIINLIHEVAKDKLVLVVTHNYPEVEKLVNRQIKMADGRIVEDIVYQNINDTDIDEHLDLDYRPLDNKIKLRLSFLNLKSTPKKTLFVFIILLVISIGLAFTMQVLNGPLKNMVTNSSEYKNNFEDTFYIYDDQFKAIDTNKIKKYDYKVNAFCLENNYTLNISSYYPVGHFLYNDSVNYKLVDGRLPKTENEILIILGEDYKRFNSNLVDYIKESYNQPLKIDNRDTNFTIVGYAEIAKKNISSFDFISDTLYFTGSEKLANYLTMISANLNVVYKHNDSELTTYAKIDYSIDSDVILKIPNSYKNDIEYKITAYQYYEYKNVKVEYVSESNVELLYNPDKTFNLDPYFLYVNSNNNPKTVRNYFASLDLKCDNIQLQESSNPLLLIYRILTIASSFNVIINLIIYLVITYFLLRRIYRSRIKDFEILRVLGVNKKDMAKIIRLELLLITIITSILGYVIIYIIAFSVPALEDFRTFGLYRLIFYFVVLFGFSLILSKNINRRVFKFTASRSMRGSDEDD